VAKPKSIKTVGQSWR